MYTTGRGGTGNMVPNDDPALTRALQDVDVPPPVAAGSADAGWFHTGRGTNPFINIDYIALNKGLDADTGNVFVGGAANVYVRSPRDIIAPGYKGAPKADNPHHEDDATLDDNADEDADTLVDEKLNRTSSNYNKLEHKTTNASTHSARSNTSTESGRERRRNSEEKSRTLGFTHFFTRGHRGDQEAGSGSRSRSRSKPRNE